ncbi:helix-turn-helix domain-containing protein [Rhodovulum sulfidophilum]|uniref:helix-turn-helix domain-containing protein n=1 Tax=Rhodovulum sulfidophilum TaxID=35806 RepID=UPI001F19427C|nr:helix-turn-helix domain-containing protein [Rhodovulum sulfidophilum]MCE8438494.1 helix-turn-helix domain-containing protein [Rhodovulum sulfidophilum]MCE8469111.1 helix-turn-helix domain-containing protein [Rhodovulum sulfidophilum]
MANFKLLSPRELAQQSGWPERRIRNLMASRQLKHIKIGGAFYLPDDAISDFIERNMICPVQAPGDPNA